MKRSRTKGPSGFLLLDKPAGISSRKALTTAMYRLESRGGNEGTLDPFATGLLIAAAGTATRFFPWFEELTKTYTAELSLGRATDTLDCTGETTVEADVPDITMDEVQAAADGLTGLIQQVPPAYSAIHVDGERAYARARRGESVDIPAREAVVERFEITAVQDRVVEFCCTVHRGTYVRTLGADLARRLNTYGHLTGLRRTAIGPFRAEDAVAPDSVQLGNLIDAGEALSWLPPFPLDEEEGGLFANGTRLERKGENEGDVRVYCGHRFMGIGRLAEGTLIPVRLLPQ